MHCRKSTNRVRVLSNPLPETDDHSFAGFHRRDVRDRDEPVVSSALRAATFR